MHTRFRLESTRPPSLQFHSEEVRHAMSTAFVEIALRPVGAGRWLRQLPGRLTEAAAGAAVVGRGGSLRIASNSCGDVNTKIKFKFSLS